MTFAQLPAVADEPDEPDEPVGPGLAVPSFDAVYTETASFVWTNARRLGVPQSQLDDVLQDVFVVVHRKLADFEPRASIKTWVCAILINVVRDRRRAFSRKGRHELAESAEPADDRATPEEQASNAQALRLVQQVLERMPQDRVELIVLAMLERMSLRELAEVTGVNENTLRSRLSKARCQFDDIYMQMSEGSMP